MIEGRNLACIDVLHDIAFSAAKRFPHAELDVECLWADFQSEEARAAFREDLKDASYNGLDRFPAFLFRGTATQGVVSIGYRPYKSLLEITERVLPSIGPRRDPSLVAYANYWQRLTSAELAAALDITPDEARKRFEQALLEGEFAVSNACLVD